MMEAPTGSLAPEPGLVVGRTPGGAVLVRLADGQQLAVPRGLQRWPQARQAQHCLPGSRVQLRRGPSGPSLLLAEHHPDWPLLQGLRPGQPVQAQRLVGSFWVLPGTRLPVQWWGHPPADGAARCRAWVLEVRAQQLHLVLRRVPGENPPASSRIS